MAGSWIRPSNRWRRQPFDDAAVRSAPTVPTGLEVAESCQWQTIRWWRKKRKQETMEQSRTTLKISTRLRAGSSATWKVRTCFAKTNLFETLTPSASLHKQPSLSRAKDPWPWTTPGCCLSSTPLETAWQIIQIQPQMPSWNWSTKSVLTENLILWRNKTVTLLKHIIGMISFMIRKLNWHRSDLLLGRQRVPHSVSPSPLLGNGIEDSPLVLVQLADLRLHAHVRERVGEEALDGDQDLGDRQARHPVVLLNRVDPDVAMARNIRVEDPRQKSNFRRVKRVGKRDLEKWFFFSSQIIC